jgi:hypothetical protein
VGKLEEDRKDAEKKKSVLPGRYKEALYKQAEKIA